MQAATPPMKRQEAVIMVGVPGSGKTTYARERLSGHVHVSLDANNLVLTGADKVTLLNRYEREEPLNLGRQPYGMPPNPAGRKYCSSLSEEQGSRNRKREYVQVADALRIRCGDVVIDDTNLTRYDTLALRADGAAARGRGHRPYTLRTLPWRWSATVRARAGPGCLTAYCACSAEMLEVPHSGGGL